jgi:hypothetical protein
MSAGVLPSLTQMMISQVPRWAEVGVQLRTLLVCQAGAVTSGIQLGVPARRRKSAYWVVDGVPPLAVAVQARAVPEGDDAGLLVLVTLRGAGMKFPPSGGCVP